MIRPYLGKRIDEPFEEAEHSRSARNIFKDLPYVGKIKSTSETSSTGSSDDKDIKVEDNGLETNGFAGDDNCKASGLEGQSL